ncbi:MAG: Wzz/FepE/Etk N-terminal domain-containing protein [Mangrovibacterium sp.]
MTASLPSRPVSNTPPDDDEIDLIALARTLWNGRKILIRSVIICFIIGLLIAFLSPKEYTSATIVVPQLGQSSSNMGGLSSLAAMAGFNLSDMTNADGTLSPMVYPQIISSVPYQLELMNAPFTFSETDHPVSIFEYYTRLAKPGILSTIKRYTFGLPFVILKAVKGESQKPETGTRLITLTEEQEEIRKLIEEKLTLEVNSKEGYLTLKARMPEAALSAEVAQYARELLQKYITRLKIEKASEQLNFIRGRYTEKKKEFEQAQEKLALFRDRNKNVATAMAGTEEERLQSEYSIAFNVYSELAKQLEQAQIRVKEDTPVFSVLAPAVVPGEKSKPRKALILIIWIFLGGLAGTGIIFGKQYLVTIRQRWNENG